MTVFVDDMRAPFGRMIMCHMLSDSEDELHAMAKKIGVARRWYQGDHYDIALSKRALAIKNGAVAITRRQLGAMLLNRRRTGLLGTPPNLSGCDGHMVIGTQIAMSFEVDHKSEY